MFVQYWKIREELDDSTLLFYRMGDFYELFGQDAIKAAPHLGVQLTARNKNAEIPVPMCGVPVHAVDAYVEKLVAQKLRVALCEQLSEAGEAGSKLVERGIVRILTSGLPVDPSRLDAKKAHFLASIQWKLLKKNLAVFDVVLFDFLGSKSFQGEIFSLESLAEFLNRFDPQEILLSQSQLKGIPADWKNFILFDSLSPFSTRITPWAAQCEASALDSLKEYLKYTQRVQNFDFASQLPEPQALSKIFSREHPDYAQIAPQVLEQWNVFPELFEMLDGAGSAGGSRSLREVLARPLKAPSRILARQKTLLPVSTLEEFLAHSRQVFDLERILGRFRVGAALPRELLQIQHSLNFIFKAMGSLPLTHFDFLELTRLEGFENFEKLKQALKDVSDLMDRILQSKNDEASRDSGTLLSSLIREGFDPHFDELKKLHSGAEEWLKNFENSLRAQTEIPSLKVRFNRIFGYYIEVTKTHLSKVPASFERKQTTVSGERFTNTELKNKEREILRASSELEEKSEQILSDLQKKILLHLASFQELFRQFSFFDAVLGAQNKVIHLRRFGDWNLPVVTSGAFQFEIQDSRHPLIEMRRGFFTPNSLSLGQSTKRILLLTGPNMAGKSTLMRQVGLCLLLAQCGFPVPASQLHFSPAHAFFSRMGAQDKILEGESTFMVEMKETSLILREANRDSFVLLDEIGRGTSTHDGLSLADSILDFLEQKLQVIGIFATHYHELADKAQQANSLVNASMSIEENGRDLRFLHQLKFEAAKSSYGLYVARLAGLPKVCIDRAEKKLKSLEHNQNAPLLHSLDLFKMDESLVSENQQFVQEIKELDLDSLSPKAAWQYLEKLKTQFN